MQKKMILGLGAMVLVPFFTLGAFGADYPTKSITIINPMAPGGGHDLVARSFAAVAEKYFGQPVVVVNKPGATGLVGGMAALQAPADGYTIAESSTNVTTTVEWEIANGRKPPFTRHDFTPIASFWLQPTVVVVNYEIPWKTLSDFINDAKANPGKYAFCSGGLYGMSHLPAEILVRAAGIKVRHVPYKGGGPCISAIVGKHVEFGTLYPGPSLSLVRANKVRALAVQSNKREKNYPDTPTVKELGIDAEFYGWVGFLMPKATPAPIVEKLREVAKKVAQDKQFIDMIEKAGDEVRFLNAGELEKHMDLESERVRKVMAELVKEAAKK